MIDSDVPRTEAPLDIWRMPCRRCAGYCLVYSILDSKRGNTVRLYRCAGCGELIWDDGAKPI